MKYEKLVPFLMNIAKSLPKRNAIKSPSHQLSCSPFFVFGSGRNGSTMFSAMLDAHPDMVVPTEQFRLPNVIIKYNLMNILEWRDLVSIAVGEFAASDGTVKWNIEVGDLLKKLYELPKNEQSLQRIIDEIYVCYGKLTKDQFIMWGDKTPRNTFFLKYIYNVFPESKYLFLIRDGRDVIRSWIVRDKTDDIHSRADAWNYSIQMYEWMRKKNPQNLLMVRYEELVSQPEATLKDVCAFLNVSYDSRMLRFQGFTEKLGEDVVEGSNFQQIRNPVNTNSIGKWKRELSATQISALDQLIGTNLKKYGFER